MEIAYPPTPSHSHPHTVGLLPSALSTVTPPPTKKRPLHDTTTHNVSKIAIPRFAEPVNTFTPPDNRKRSRPETVIHALLLADSIEGTFWSKRF
jgi:hypothetical protein